MRDNFVITPLSNTPITLITGGFGKLGSRVVATNPNVNFLMVAKGKTYKKIKENVITLDLNNSTHLKKLNRHYKITTLIHFSVSRNPMSKKEIRDFNTLVKDTDITIKILSTLSNLKKIVVSSSASVYKSNIFKSKVSNNRILVDIKKFLSKKDKTSKYRVKDYFGRKQNRPPIDPLCHHNNNVRLNGSNKIINDILFVNYALQNKVDLFIIRPSIIKEEKHAKKK